MKEFKEIFKENRKGWQIIQWATMNAFGTLVYSEYISKIQKIEKPVLYFKIAKIRSIRDVLYTDGILFEAVLRLLFDYIKDSEYFEYLPDFIKNIFNDKSIFNYVMTKYIFENVEYKVPAVICKKFNLDTEQTLFREDIGIDLFNRMYNQKYIIDYVLEEFVLQLVMFTHESVDIRNIEFDPDCKWLLSINNKNAIAPILLNETILKNGSIMELIKFITNTEIEENDKIIFNTSENNECKSIILKEE